MEASILSKPKYFFLIIKRNILSIIFITFIAFLIIFSNSNILAVKTGLSLWINNIVPSLLPFFIASELLSSTNFIYKIGTLLNPIMRPLFNVPGIGSYPFLMGIISGYPIGAKIVSNLKNDNIISNNEAERLISFTNNSGPLFIIGAIGCSLFGNKYIGILLFISHILSCISVGLIFRFWKYNKNENNYKNIDNNFNTYYQSYSSKVNKLQYSFSDLGEILSNSILNSIKNIILIGGFVILFSVILSILNNTNLLILISTFSKPLFSLFGITDIRFSLGTFSGILELTNGLNIISQIPCKKISINLILSSFLIGFGGLSVLLQVLSIISKSHISIKPYFLGKLLQGIFSIFYTFILINIFPIFNYNL